MVNIEVLKNTQRVKPMEVINSQLFSPFGRVGDFHLRR